MSNNRIFYLVLLVLMLAACGAAEPVEVTREVPVTVVVEQEKIVEVTVEVEKVVEVEKIVEVTVIVEVTPEPTKAPPTATPQPQEPVVIGEPIIFQREQYDGDGIVDVLVFVENPNEDWWVPVSEIVASVFDADGNIIGTESEYMVLAPASETAVLFGGINIADWELGKIEMSFSPEPFRPAAKYPSIALELVQANLVGDNIVGQIQNTGEEESSGAEVIFVIKDAGGEMIGTSYTFADDIRAGASVPFEDHMRSEWRDLIGSFDVYIIPSTSDFW